MSARRLRPAPHHSTGDRRRRRRPASPPARCQVPPVPPAAAFRARCCFRCRRHRCCTPNLQPPPVPRRRRRLVSFRRSPLLHRSHAPLNRRCASAVSPTVTAPQQPLCCSPLHLCSHRPVNRRRRCRPPAAEPVTVNRRHYRHRSTVPDQPHHGTCPVQPSPQPVNRPLLRVAAQPAAASAGRVCPVTVSPPVP